MPEALLGRSRLAAAAYGSSFADITHQLEPA